MAKKKYQKSEQEVNQNAATAPAEEQLATPVAETESSAAAPEAEAQEVKTQWGPIVKDFCILLVIMGILGYACNLLKDAFAHKSPTDSLVSLIRKGDLKEVNGEEVDEPFLKELKDGKQKAADFVNVRDANQRTPLMWAAYANFNNPEKAAEVDTNRLYYIDALFENKADIQAKDEDGFTALHWAAWSGMRFTSYKLIKKGIDINQPENNGYTPLMLAAMRGNDKVVDLLLKMGANPALKNTKGETAADLVKAAEVAYSKRDSFVYGPVFSKEREEAYQRTVELLSKANAAISDEELRKLEVELEIDMLSSQAEARAARKIAELAKRDETRATISLIPLVSLDEKDIDLHHRVKGEVAAIAALDKAAEPGTPSLLNKVDEQGNSALHVAARTGKALCCYALLNGGLNATLKNKAGETPLMLAALNGHTMTVQVFVSLDKAEIKEDAAAVAKALAGKNTPNAQEIIALLNACNPSACLVKEYEFEQRRLASDAIYAKQKADAEAKAKADAEAAAKAAEEARAKAAAEAAAKEEARVRAIAEAEARTAQALQVITEAANLKAEAERRNVEAANLKTEAARQMTEAYNMQAEAARRSKEATDATAAATAAKAEAAKLTAEAAAAKAAADKQAAEAVALKTEAEKQAAEAAALKTEAEKQAAEAATLKAEAEKQAAEAAAAKAAAEAAPAPEATTAA